MTFTPCDLKRKASSKRQFSPLPPHPEMGEKLKGAKTHHCILATPYSNFGIMSVHTHVRCVHVISQLPDYLPALVARAIAR